MALLPLIDFNPSDINCVYSALLFVCEQADHYDQPLDVILSAHQSSLLKRVLLRLGRFHTLLSFLGNMGHFM